MARIFTLMQFCAVYQLGEKSVRKMLRSGQLIGFKTPSGWRIPDVGNYLVELARRQALPLENASFVRTAEVADLMGLSERRVRPKSLILPCRNCRISGFQKDLVLERDG